MKILQLSSEKTWRGGEQQIAYLSYELGKKGMQSVYGVRHGSAFEKYCRENGLDFISLPFSGEWDIITASAIKKICHGKDIDLIHAHSAHSLTSALMAALLGNLPPIVVSRRVDFPIRKNFLSRYKYNYKKVRKIICVSNCIAEIIKPEIIHAERIITIYDGIEIGRFEHADRTALRKEFNISPNEKIIGNVAALAPHKDYFTFLNTAKLLSEKMQCRFVIIGEGELKQQLQARINELNLQQLVIMTGFRNDVENLLTGFDVLLFTSSTEGLGSSVLDAMAAGVPVVATATGGIPEIIQHGKTGLLAPVNDAVTLAAEVINIINDKGLREDLIKEAKDRVLYFSKEIMAEKTAHVYKEVLGYPG